MYIKIVRHLDEEGVSDSRGSLEEKVVPSLHHMFECSETEYRKVTVDCMATFHKRMQDIETVRVVTPMPDEDNTFEYLQVKMYHGEGDDDWVGTLVGRDCTLYIMNDEGKTIDRMICR